MKTSLVAATTLTALVLFIVPATRGVTAALLFGWVAFLARVLPRMTVDVGTVVVGLAALVLFTAGVHVATRSWWRGATSVPWRLRWSVTAVAVVVLLFTAGVALVAAIHQVGWLATSPEPLFVEGQAVPPGFGWPSSRTEALKSTVLALHNYQSCFQMLPPGGTFSADGTPLHSWETFCLPFLRAWQRIDLDMEKPWNGERNAAYFRSVVPDFINPELPPASLFDAEGFGVSHYSVNVHVMGPNRGRSLANFPDGTLHTLLLGEVSTGFRPWGDPVNWRDPGRGIGNLPYQFGGPPNAGGANFALADGSVRFIAAGAHPDVLRALATPDGGEQVDDSHVLLPPR
jgi:prepilin-type processing-associated H-X9-DG protein